MTSKLIVIQGPSGTGKSRLARELAVRLDYPLFAKDAFKEKRFDEFGRTIPLKQWARAEFDSWDKCLKGLAKL